MSDSLTLVGQGRKEWVIRSDSEVRQRNEHKHFRRPRGCHIAGNAGLVTGVERALQ